MFSPWNSKEADFLRLNAESQARKGWAALREHYRRNPPPYANHYNPNQARVPAGDPDGGQWTRVAGGITEAGQAALSGEGFIKVAGGGRYLPPGGRYGPLTAEQTGRYVSALRRLFEALAQIRGAGDSWEPYAPSITSIESNEGFVAIAEAAAQQAEDRLKSLSQGQLRYSQWPAPQGRQPARSPGIGHNRGPDFPGRGLPPSSDPRHWLQLYRIVHNYYDLLGHPTWPFDKGTVAVAFVDGIRRPIFGANSKAPSSAYTPDDRNAANRMREILLKKYPDVMEMLKIGDIENQSVFHAEATVLLRIAAILQRQGRTLAGRVLEIHSDRDVCSYSCRKVLPKIGLELGNPTVIFIDTQTGRRRIMRDGEWEGGWR